KPNWVTVADVNGDGRPDLVAANKTGNSVSVLLNTNPAVATGNFGPAQDFAVGDLPLFVTAADVNRDGILDLITANYGPGVDPNFTTTNNVSVLLGKGDGTFQPARTFTAGTVPDSIAVED